jgi:hypothetical protein
MILKINIVHSLFTFRQTFLFYKQLQSKLPLANTFLPETKKTINRNTYIFNKKNVNKFNI